MFCLNHCESALLASVTSVNLCNFKNERNVMQKSKIIKLRQHFMDGCGLQKCRLTKSSKDIILDCKQQPVFFLCVHIILLFVLFSLKV